MRPDFPVTRFFSKTFPGNEATRLPYRRGRLKFIFYKNSFRNENSFTEFRSVNDDRFNCEVRFLTMYFGREGLTKCHESI